MLLSMFASFLLARLLRGKVYFSFLTIVLLILSFFSVGVPHYESIPVDWRMFENNQGGVLFDDPFPLSFPFYSSSSVESTVGYTRQDYEVHFLTLTFYTTGVEVALSGGIVLRISWHDYFDFFLLFFLINAAGAMVGYWLSRRTGFAKSSGKQEKSPAERDEPPKGSLA